MAKGDYRDSDFANLFLKVYQVPFETDLFKRFPILNAYSVFKADIGNLEREKVLRYIIYAFDKNSPLNTISDILERRVEAALLAGFKPKKNKFEPEVEAMIKSVNNIINSMIIQYCIMQGEEDYTTLVSFQEALRSQLEILLNPGEDDDVSKIIKNVKELRTQINELRQNLLINNVDTFLTMSLNDFSEAEKLELSPEYFAEKYAYWDGISKYYKKVNDDAV